jgi:sterol desaturase/sphingolipid hydroxylase (fatty acid hydroxylase superfamily)
MTRGRRPGLRSLGLVAVAAALIWLERRRALRPRVEPALRHSARNLVVAGLSAATVQMAEVPVVLPLARTVERRRWGLVQRLPLPRGLRDAIAVLALDYTLYAWHVLTHRVNWLWRLHLVHHVDLDLDASTALRFHFAEIAASVPWRALQVTAIGVSPRALGAWQSLTLASILFHHSNTALPLRLERWLSRVLVTPRMHGIHHSAVRAETDSNFSSGLALWDWLHGTIRLNVPQAAITIGVPAYRDPREISLPGLLALPLTHARDTWRLSDGTEPVRADEAGVTTRLAP